MATLFEDWLVGEDEEHLGAVAEAALDEVQRVERLLSRFDPAGEIFRVNREAVNRPTLVDRELFGVLADCRVRFEQTEGYFDVCADTRIGVSLPLFLDETGRTVQLTEPSASIDLGGYGKGYALDAAACVVREHDITAGFLHGGTSSALALDAPTTDNSWLVGVRDPFAEDERELTQVQLLRRGLSSSAAFNRTADNSDVIDPVEPHALTRQSACTVLAPTAVDAEVLSTALLVMGKARAIDYLRRTRDVLPTCEILWVGQDEGETTTEWL